MVVVVVIVVVVWFVSSSFVRSFVRSLLGLDSHGTRVHSPDSVVFRRPHDSCNNSRRVRVQSV